VAVSVVWVLSLATEVNVVGAETQKDTTAPAAGTAAVLSTDASLKALTLSVGTFAPEFHPTRKYLIARAPHAAELVTLIPVVNETHATVTVNGTAVVSGQASGPVTLSVGRNLLSVAVMAQDAKTTNTTTVEVIRAHPAPDWVRVNERCPWVPRDSAGELVFKDRMWLFGGYIPEVINDVWNSTDGKDWAKVGTIPCPSGVNIPVNFVYGDRMWVVCNKGELYSSPDGVTWTLVTDQAPWRGRYAAGGVVFAGRMWVMGGLQSSRGEICNDVWSSSDGVVWTLATANAPWCKRQLFSMLTVFQDALWVVGGGITKYHPFKGYTDVWKSGDGKTWTKVSEGAPWPARIWSSATTYRNRLWVMGGFRAEPTWNNFDDVWYSSDGATWTRLETETVWSARHELSVYVFADKLWVVAGNSWPLMNDVWCLDLPGLVFLTQPVLEEFVTAQYSYRARADFNRSAGKVRYRLVDSPAWLSVEPESGLVRGTPDKEGDYPVCVEAFDAAGETARQAYTLHVLSLK
jgi:hypothetical protein